MRRRIEVGCPVRRMAPVSARGVGCRDGMTDWGRVAALSSDRKQRLQGVEIAAKTEMSPDDAAELGALIDEARKTERKLLIKSIDETIAALPRIFRGPVRAIAFGGLK